MIHGDWIGRSDDNTDFYGMVYVGGGVGSDSRVTGVGVAWSQRCPKGQGSLRTAGPLKYAILSRNVVLSQFTHFLKGFHGVFNKIHPASESFQ